MPNIITSTVAAASLACVCALFSCSMQDLVFFGWHGGIYDARCASILATKMLAFASELLVFTVVFKWTVWAIAVFSCVLLAAVLSIDLVLKRPLSAALAGLVWFLLTATVSCPSRIGTDADTLLLFHPVVEMLDPERWDRLSFF